MKRHTAAVIGLRGIGVAHCRAWTARADAQLVAVADLDEAVRGRVVADFGVAAAFGDYRELLARCDAEIVTICLPTPLHEAVAVECLRQGRHVLCEKPPALDAAAAARMAGAARAAGRVLGYGFQRRFHPQVRAAQRVIEQGRTGPLFYGRAGWVRSEPSVGATAAWKLDRNTGGGGLFNIGIHLLDVAWYLMGRPRPVAAAAFGSTAGTGIVAAAAGLSAPATPAFDTTAALVRFEHEGTDVGLLLESSLALHRVPGQQTYCELSGEQGGVGVYPPVFVAGGRTEPLDAPPDEREARTRQALLDDFLRAVETGGEPCAGPDDGVVLMQIVEAVERSAHERREVRIGQ